MRERIRQSAPREQWRPASAGPSGVNDNGGVPPLWRFRFGVPRRLQPSVIAAASSTWRDQQQPWRPARAGPETASALGLIMDVMLTSGWERPSSAPQAETPQARQFRASNRSSGTVT